MSVAYLGPEGTFAHQAVDLVAGAGAPAEPCATVAEVIEAVAEGRCERGVVPFENSVEGQVNLTVDALAHGDAAVQVCGEVVLDVTFGAYRHHHDDAPPAVAASHPVGLAQCRRFVHENGLASREMSSTAEACRAVAEDGEEGLVALASPVAALRWGLVPVAEGVEDFPGAQTRFVVVGPQGAPPTGDDRTMLVLVPPDEKAGVLMRALEHISGRGLNLSAIASRPLRVRLGEYCFVLVIDDHADSPGLSGALAALRADGYSIRVLGTYPKWRP